MRDAIGSEDMDAVWHGYKKKRDLGTGKLTFARGKLRSAM
jgi:hypothetical protein